MKKVLKDLLPILIGLLSAVILSYLLVVYVSSPLIPGKQIVAHEGDYFILNGGEGWLMIFAVSKNPFVMSVETSDNLYYVSSSFTEENRETPLGWIGPLYQIECYDCGKIENSAVVRLEKGQGNVYIHLGAFLEYGKVEVEYHHPLIRGIWKIITALGLFISLFFISWGVNRIPWSMNCILNYKKGG